MDMAGAMSVEETQASQHSQAMAPGIDALRRRRAAVLQQQQQQSPGEDGMPLPPQQAPLTNGHAEPQHASAEQNSVSTGDQVQAVAQTASHQQANHTGRFQDEALDASRDSPVDLPLHTESDDTAWTGAVAEPHAGDTSDVSSSREEHPLMKAVTNGDQADYDSLLDAIASGSLDWEPPAQQASSSQASEQQLNTHHHMQTRLPSQEPASDSTKLPQHTWHEQAEAMPSNPADTPLQHPDTAPAPAAAAPGQQPVTPSLPTATPGSTHQHSTTEASQRAAEAQDLANSGQSQQPAEAADQAWPWEDGKGADTPALSADIVARSGSRLRLRTASSSARRPQKQSSRKVASRSQTPSNLLSPKGTASQGAVQETEWRVTNSQQTTAEEFVKRPADLDNQRPVWAASAAVPAGAGVEAAQHEAGSRQSPPPSESRPLTKQELRALAARQGLDYDRLLADALSRGIPMSD